MDASATGNATTTAARFGRIVIARHGRPALDRNAGPKLDWRAYRAWWARYEGGSLAPGQDSPAGLKDIAANGAVIFSSTRPRAMETAKLVGAGKVVTHHAIFNEAPLPPPRWADNKRFLPKTWNKIARVAWMMGHADGDEHILATRRRAEEAADMLIATAAQGNDVVLAAHGWFNRMLRPALARKGWRCTRDGGDSYWSYRVYEKK